MIGKFKQAFSDVLYVSKVTQTNKKKIIIIISVILSQVIAFADILIILLFTNLFTGSSILRMINIFIFLRGHLGFYSLSDYFVSQVK